MIPRIKNACNYNATSDIDFDSFVRVCTRLADAVILSHHTLISDIISLFSIRGLYIRAHLNDKLSLWYSANTFFVWFDLHLIGRKVNHQSGILTFDSNKTNENEFDKKSCGNYFALCVIGFGELVQLDMACSWNRSQPRTLEPCCRLLHRWDSPFSRGRATGADAARGPTAPSTE